MMRRTRPGSQGQQQRDAEGTQDYKKRSSHAPNARLAARPSASVAMGGAVKFRCRTAYISRALAGIQRPMRIIIRFSVSEMKPSGTLLPPPTQAHFSSRLSM